MTKKPALMIACIIMLALLTGGFGCGGGTPAGVCISSPANASILQLGEEVTVTATINLEGDVDGVWLQLWDIDTDWKTNWTFDYSLTSESLSFSEIIVVPMDAPIGDDYRLSVTGTLDDRPRQGYSI